METSSSRQRRTKGWRRFLLGLSLIGSAANVCASAVAASRRKKATVIASSSSPSAKPIENTGTFPESNGVHWWHLKASHDVGDGYDDDTDEKEDEESTAYSYHRDKYEIASRVNAIKRAPWRRPSDRGFQLVSGIGLGLGLGLGLQVPAAKRLIVTGAVALFVANRLHKLQTSEPVRRSLYFWHHAGPIVVRSLVSIKGLSIEYQLVYLVSKPVQDLHFRIIPQIECIID